MIQRQPILTERLLLEPVTPEHVPAIWAATEASLPELRTWMTWAKQASEANSKEFAERAADDWEAGRDYVFAIMKEGEYLGGVGLHSYRLDGLGELGYWIRTDRAGQGYTTEAGEALVAFAFDVVKLYRLELRTGVENHASQRVAEKLGFRKEGTLRQGAPLGTEGGYDCYIYGLLAEDRDGSA
ncbi:MAG: GNAT family N-acetyltransferase [Actinomycetota bacterium]